MQKSRHKKLVVLGLLVTLAAWLAWMLVLTEAEVEEPAALGSVAQSERAAV